MDIGFFGPDSDFFTTAFFDNDADELYNVEVVGTPTSTTVVLEQPLTGAITTVSGFGFTFDANGDVTGGTITGMSFAQGATTVATFSNMSWGLVAADAALEAASNDNDGPLSALFSAQPITLDASTATSALTMNYEIVFSDTLHITGSGFNDRLVGGTATDTLLGGAGKDDLFGGEDKDRLEGGDSRDKLFGGKGKDKLIGNKGKDDLFGEAAKDNLVGGAGNDLLDGGKGNDLLKGGKGDDTLDGGAGFDLFIFKLGLDEGVDTLLGWEDGIDLIRIAGGSMGDISTSTGGGDTTISITGGTDVILDGFTGSITAADFDFS
ncbi:MAG: calcium-binding protein [Gammaproteobacteria bacterium]|nr:calcium-binding protein [Gammaproteobacteria bacterium]